MHLQAYLLCPGGGTPKQLLDRLGLILDYYLIKVINDNFMLLETSDTGDVRANQ